jgi:anti-sigma B factor antagonist
MTTVDDGGRGRTMDREVLPLTGDIDLVTAPVLRAELKERLDRTSSLVLDLSELHFIDSTGLGVLVGALRRVRTEGGDIRLAGAPSSIRRVFAVTGLDQVFTLFPTVDEAMAQA